jgi:hypothetical protein
MTVPIVKYKFRTINKIVLVFFLSTMAAMFLPKVPKFLNEFHYLFSVLIIISIVAYITLPLIFKNYIIIGSLRFEENSIKIFEADKLISEFPFEKMIEIIFETYDTSNDGGYGVRLGISNWIEIHGQNKKDIKCRLLISNESVLFYLDKQLNQTSTKVKVIKKGRSRIVRNLKK